MDKKTVDLVHCYENVDLFRHGPVMIFKWENDRNWTVRSVSGNVENILGYRGDHFSCGNISYKSLLHPEDLDRIVAEHESFLSSNGEACEDKIYRLVSRQEKDVWVHAYTVMVRDSEGRLEHCLSYLIDVTKRILAERALKQSEELYRSLLDNQANAVFLHKLLPGEFSKFREVNQSAVERYGYSRQEFFRLSPTDLICPGARPADHRAIRRQLLTHGHLEFETVHVKKTGESFPVQVNARIIEPYRDKERYVLATVQDITERKKAERERQLSSDRLMTVLNSIDANIHVSDMTNHRILFMNENMVREFGRDLTGESCWKVFRNDSAPCDFCANGSLLDAAGQPTGLKVWQQRNPADGRHFINYDRAIQWTDGRMVKLRIAMDISELKSMEEQLRQKFKMEAVGAMAGGIAHDFNNNLAIILGNVEMAQMRLPSGSEIGMNLENAKIAILRARDLVQQILTYSRQKPQSFKPVKLPAVIDETLRLLRSTLPSSVKIESKIENRAVVVSADFTQVQEILINLCNNAVHAMAGEGRIRLVLDAVDVAKREEVPIQFSAEPGRFARISIEDSGHGMDEEVLQRIFDPFFTTKDVGEGTGMGLAVVHGILKGHRGFARVESSPGRGSRFEVYFPALTDERRGEDAIDQPLPHGSERVLFVDDEKLLTDVGSRMLSEHGYRVITAASGREALELFRKDPYRFDLVISDQTMPELTGKMLIRALLDIRPGLPTIICTGYSDQIDEREAAGMGVKAFCMKPLDMAEMLRTVRQVLDGSPKTDERP